MPTDNGAEQVVELPAEYEPPKVETVLTQEDLAREIQYAGITVVN